MRAAGFLIALVMAAAATDAMAAPRSVVIGDIVIRYDDTRFRLLAHSPRPWPVADDSRQYAGFVCIDPYACFDDAILAVNVMPATDTPEEPAFPLPDWIDEPRDLWGDGAGILGLGGTRRDFGGLDLAGTLTYSRCRSAGGVRYEATGVLGDTRYVFSTGFPTCGGGPRGASQEMFEGLLSGIAVLPNAR